jgi:hypothetical protein
MILQTTGSLIGAGRVALDQAGPKDRLQAVKGEQLVASTLEIPSCASSQTLLVSS